MTAELNTLVLRNNRAAAQSAGVVLTGDGMVRLRTQRRAVTTLLIIVCALVLLSLAKAGLLLVLGTDGFDAAVTVLEGGAATDRLAAWAFRIDPLAQAVFQAL